MSFKAIRPSGNHPEINSSPKRVMGRCDGQDEKVGTTETLFSYAEVCYFDFNRIQTSAKMACGEEQGMSYEKFESDWLSLCPTGRAVIGMVVQSGRSDLS